MLRAALSLIRASVPAASVVHLSTSDQNYYGFVLTDVGFPDGTTLSTIDQSLLQRLIDCDELHQLLTDLDWDCAVGEDDHGIAQVSLTEHPRDDEPCSPRDPSSAYVERIRIAGDPGQPGRWPIEAFSDRRTMIDEIPSQPVPSQRTDSALSVDRGGFRYAVMSIGPDFDVTAYGPYASVQQAADVCSLIKGTVRDRMAVGFVKLSRPFDDPTSALWPVMGGGTVAVPDAVAAAITARFAGHPLPSGNLRETPEAAIWAMTLDVPVSAALVGTFTSSSAAAAWLRSVGLDHLPLSLGIVRVLSLGMAPVSRSDGQVGKDSISDTMFLPERREALVLSLFQDEPDGLNYLMAYGPFADALHAVAYWHDLASRFPMPQLRNVHVLPVDVPTEEEIQPTNGAGANSTGIHLPSIGTTHTADLHVVWGAGPAEENTTVTGWFHGLKEVYTWYTQRSFPPGTILAALPVQAPNGKPRKVGQGSTLGRRSSN